MHETSPISTPELNPSMYKAIQKSALALADNVGLDPALAALELTARSLGKPVITKETRRSAEQDIPKNERTRRIGDAMVIIFHNEPRYPTHPLDTEKMRREKVQVIGKIRDIRGLPTESLINNFVEELAGQYVSLSEHLSMQREIKDFIEDIFTPGEIPPELQGMAGTLRRCRQAFWRYGESL